jgi:hypothetical protein
MDAHAVGGEITSLGDRTEQFMAEMVLRILHEVYPQHPWRVGFAKETVFFKHDACDNRYGFSLGLPGQFSYSDLKRNVAMGAGEFLERAGLPRGTWNGELGLMFDRVEDAH